ncbi:GTPase Era [Acidaminobacter hydrogenoformans]|uniref:GTPase Era n=1 Tax=Acidaminobacter hydrogenoformans DSM 2784 TaxID=1120920 RepID=A0A1G5RSU2_9FIRM|nr:GTPase Era [Acidaminobacter hydrogenoformans]SCZ77153.1 GTP-binding protein Era [Acidaminobacter hydrogenoformans DSM 2784]
MPFKSGFVSIIGRPNVGKSTLLNAITGEKIAIMSDKPQTTRNRIQAIYTTKESQIIFVDTPGMTKAKNKLGDFMIRTALDTLKEVDAIIFVVDDSLSLGPADKFILQHLEGIKTPVILAINKVDKIMPDQYAIITKLYSDYDFIKEIISISALQGANIGPLVEKVIGFLPEGPMYYPGDMITDQPERAIVAEIIREKLLHYLDQEVPHGVAVEIEAMKERENSNMFDIRAVIVCERESHKGIIIGKGGRKLKGVGKSAREEIERLLGAKVFLELWVKVRPGWRDNDLMLKNFGYKE